MKYAIIADIHGNLDALQVVLEDIRAQNATHVVCLGDIVGYNANPKECLQIIRDMNIPCVKGNHDEYCSKEDELEGFNPNAAAAVFVPGKFGGTAAPTFVPATPTAAASTPSASSMCT